MNFTEPQNECYCINLESTGNAPTAEDEKKDILGFTFCALKGGCEVLNEWWMLYFQSAFPMRSVSVMFMGLVIQKTITAIGKQCAKTHMIMNLTVGVEVSS